MEIDLDLEHEMKRVLIILSDWEGSTTTPERRIDMAREIIRKALFNEDERKKNIEKIVETEVAGKWIPCGYTLEERNSMKKLCESQFEKCDISGHQWFVLDESIKAKHEAGNLILLAMKEKTL